MRHLDKYNEELVRRLEENAAELREAVEAGEHKRAREIVKRIDEILNKIDDPYVLNSAEYRELSAAVKRLEGALKIDRVLDIALTILPILYLAAMIIITLYVLRGGP